MIKRLSLLFLLLTATLACGGIGLAYEHDLTADYAVWATDLLEQAAVVQKDPQGSSASSVIWPMVFAYGWNNDFIVAQRHPSRGGSTEVDLTVTEWYVLVVATETVHGPLTEAEYHQLRQELGVPAGLDFSHTIKATNLKEKQPERWPSKREVLLGEDDDTR
ncbi:MAG: DUF3997 domain-containing protein [Actinomycetia bacterium]|nr:DUF3997 domain-containing protein [Actinomycetes bacterium]